MHALLSRITQNMRHISSVATASLIFLLVATPASADGGCAHALAATSGVAHAMVAAHCGQSNTSSKPATTPTSAPSPPNAQAAVQGCATGLGAVQGTAGAPYVQAACNQLADRLGQPAPVAPASPPTAADGCATAIAATAGTPGQAAVQASCGNASANGDGSVNGCAIAHAMTANTDGQQWVDAFCPGATPETPAAPSGVAVAAVTAGCDQAIEAVLNTTAEAFVRAGCAQAIANAGAEQASADTADQGGDAASEEEDSSGLEP